MSAEGLLLPRLEDLASRAAKTGCAVSRFLTAAQARQAAGAFSGRREVAFALDGGFPGAERQIAVFTNPDWGEYQRRQHLAALRLEYRRQDSLSHRDILGAILALGISRDVVGDIDAQNPALVVCAADMAEYICQNLDKAGRVGLVATVWDIDSLPQKSLSVLEKPDTVASLRLDALVASAWNLPRAQAAQLIRGGQVQLRHQECQDVAKAVEAGDIFSARGHGRAILMEVGGLSRKGRLRIVIGIYQ